MATYESIHGTRVRYLTSDPTLDSSTEGQVWYNSTSGVNKSLVQFKAWATGGFLPTPTSNNGSATQGTQTASLSFGGSNTQPQTIEYDGYAWTTSNNLGTPRYVLSGAGTQTAALGFGGYLPATGAAKNETELYNGTNWTEVNNLNDARARLGSAGTSTAALAFGGEAPPNTANTEDWNGVSWVEVANLNTARSDLAGTGTTTNSLAIGGTPSPNKALTEEWSGSSNTIKVLTD